MSEVINVSSLLSLSIRHCDLASAKLTGSANFRVLSVATLADSQAPRLAVLAQVGLFIRLLIADVELTSPSYAIAGFVGHFPINLVRAAIQHSRPLEGEAPLFIA